ncbi:hypothetical protein SVIOM342S_08982 [Streptomyces violaceorubidus]
MADDAGTASGPAYRGTARIATAEDFAAEPSAGSAGSAGDTTDTEGPAATEDWAETEGAAGSTEDWTVDGACPDASGGEGGDPWSATMSVPEESGAGAGAAQPGCRETAAPRAGNSTHGTPCAPTEPACPEPPTAPRDAQSSSTVSARSAMELR